MRSHGGGDGGATSQLPPAAQRPRKLADAGYGLRENPKKTRRAYESAEVEHGQEETDLALCLMMLSRDTSWVKKREREEQMESKKKEYHCKSCGKIFLTHQALGGHRASHKRRMRIAEEVAPASSATMGESSTADRNEVVGHLELELSDQRNQESETWVSQQWPTLLHI